MLFNSIGFFIFFSIFFILYFLVIPVKFRYTLLLLSSYIFYMSYEPIYALLMVSCTIISFYFAKLIANQKSLYKKKSYLVLILSICIGNLFFFKYFNFFNEALYSFFGLLKINYSVPFLTNIILPVGISFFTIEIIGYVLDVYYEIRPPEKRLDKYALFISYFPKLLSGPIERSTTLLPQFYNSISFDYSKFSWGLKLFLFGLFKKMVIADRVSMLVNPVYNNPENFDAISILMATYLFAFQIYCDFSGYTDMAMGISKIIGFELTDNFNHPYNSKNISEFWRRWHISLSTWLRDYLYTPIMYSKKKWGKGALIYATLFTFILCGLWHGPKWTFIIFGLLQGIALTLEIITKKQRNIIALKLPAWFYNNLSWFLTFHFVVFCFIFFRSNSLSDSFIILNKLFDFKLDDHLFSKYFEVIDLGDFIFTILILILFLLIDKSLSLHIKKEIYYYKYLDPIVYSFLTAVTLLFGYYGEINFIYFHY